MTRQTQQASREAQTCATANRAHVDEPDLATPWLAFLPRLGERVKSKKKSMLEPNSTKGCAPGRCVRAAEVKELLAPVKATPLQIRGGRNAGARAGQGQSQRDASVGHQ